MSGRGKPTSDFDVMTMCSVKAAYVPIDDDRRCTACGELVEEPFKGNERHQTTFTADALRSIMGQGPFRLIDLSTGEETVLGGDDDGGPVM